jgi:hypothetical protein
MPKTIRMIVNPTPAGIALINPKGKVRMANPKKKSTRKKTAVAKTSPAKTTRKKVTASRGRGRGRGRRRSIFAYGNPSFFPLITEGIGLAAGSALTAFTVALIPPIGGQGLVADLIRTGATAWLLGAALKLVGLTAWARLATLGGVALMGGKIIYGVFFPAATAIFQPKQEPKAMPAGKGMGSVVTLPAGAYDAYYGSTPQIPAARRVAAGAANAAAATAPRGRNGNGMGAVVATRLRY